MTEYLYELKIPKARVAVLIGTGGKAKRDLEKATNVKLHVDSKEGDISIVGEDAVGLYCAREIVRAIGRGFSPQKAMQLLKADYSYEEINIGEFQKSKSQYARLKGRVIGTDGKSRKTIEQMTDTSLSVYGKTIGVIGESENAQFARRAVEMLLSGRPHANVYRWLEDRRTEMKRRDIIGSEVRLKDG